MARPNTKYVEPDSQVCEICEEEKAADDFYRGAPLVSVPQGKLLKWCKLCHCESAKKYRNKRSEPEKREVAARRKRYKTGHTLAQFGLLPSDVPENCEICGDGPTVEDTRLAIDHDHKTGLFRGFLCNRCNWALGLARDDPKILRRMVRYLVNHAKETEET